jgi:SAM-dependent methyltransferase
MEKLEAELKHHKGVPRTADYLRKKTGFWESVLGFLREHGRVEGPVLEVGNGPYGAFLALEEKAYCVDPLNSEYLSAFPHMRGRRNAEFISSGIEGLELREKCRTVISYNGLDHVDDPAAAIRKMLELSTGDALFLFGVDHYPSRLMARAVHALGRHIDPPHPHHFTLEDLEMLLEPFTVLERTGTSRFKSFPESLPRDGGLIASARKSPIAAAAGMAYRLAYPVGKLAGMGGKEANLGIKRMAVFVMRKKGRRKVL